MSKMMMRLTPMFALAILLLFNACNKEDSAGVDNDVATTEEAQFRDGLGDPHGGDNGALGRPGCLHLVYPVTINFPDGSTKEVASRQEMREALSEWKTNNPDATERPIIAFPHDVELPDGTVVTVENADQLREYLRQCFDGGHDHGPGRGCHACFQLIFPLTVSFPDGTSAEAANRHSLDSLVRAWRVANPDAEGRPEIAFPYEVRLKDGTTTTVTSEEDLKAILNGCWTDRPGHGLGDRERCFKLVYPVTISFPNSTEVATAENAEALIELIKAWREDNPDAEGRPELVFPQKIQLSDGTEVTVNSKEELMEIVGDCWEDRPVDVACFRIVFPVTVELPNGRKVRVQNQEELRRIIKATGQFGHGHSHHHGRGNQTKFVFPITIKYEDGTTKTINSKDELAAARKACGDDN